MEKFEKINAFFFDKAQYKVSDSFGNTVVLKVDYWNNSYELIGKLEKSAMEEINIFAKSILRRKHAVNFADN